jgi:HEAT repeat protein
VLKAATAVAFVVVLACAPRSHAGQPAPVPAAGAASAPAMGTGLLDPVAVLQSPTAPQGDRDEAARRLVQRQTPDARQTLAAILNEGGNHPAQLAVARAVAMDPNPDPSLVNPLFALVQTQQPPLMEAAVAALANYRDQADFHPRLLQLLASMAVDPAHQQREPTRVAAVHALGTMTDRDAADTLVRLVTSDAEPASIRDAAAAALSDMTGAMTIQRDAARWNDWWAANQNNGNFERDLLAARAARLAALKQRMEHVVADMQARLAAVYQRVPDKEKEPVLLEYLRGSEPETRVVGAQLVQDDFKQLRQPTPAVRDQLRRMISDSSPQVRVAVAQALFVLNDDEAFLALLDQVNREGDPDVRIALAAALVPMRDKRVVEPLLKMLSDPSPAVVEAAAKGLKDENLAPLIQKDAALSQRVARELRDALQRNTASGNGSVPLRAALVDAMGATRDPAMLDTYRAIVERPAEPVPLRAAALRALGQLSPGGRVSPAEVIKGSLNDRDDSIRLEAVRAMRTTADVLYAGYLFDRIKPETERNPMVREEAWAVLRNLLDQADTRTLSSWADVAVIREAPERRIEINKALLKKYIAAADDGNAASVRQNIGQDLMKLSASAAAAGDTELAKARAKEADLYFKPALDFYAARHAQNQAMFTGALMEFRMEALLASGDYPAATDFAVIQIAQDPANGDILGAKLRNEVDRLAKAGRGADALQLIDAINGMRVKLPRLDLDRIHQIETALHSSGGNDGGTSGPQSPPPTPRSASGSPQRDVVGSGQ